MVIVDVSSGRLNATGLRIGESRGETPFENNERITRTEDHRVIRKTIGFNPSVGGKWSRPVDKRRVSQDG